MFSNPTPASQKDLSHLIEQNNYTNIYLHTLGQQIEKLDISNPASTSSNSKLVSPIVSPIIQPPTIHQSPRKIDKPFSFPKNLLYQTLNPPATINNEFLTELSKRLDSSDKDKNIEPNLNVLSKESSPEISSSNSPYENSSNSESDQEQSIPNINKLSHPRYYGKIKNYYNRPTPVDL